MENNPLFVWIALAIIELVLAMCIMIYTVRVQIEQFKYKTSLQPLKWWLLGALIALIVFNLPILNIYSISLLGQKAAVWETALAVVSNATGHLIFAIFILLVYRFKGTQ